MEVARTSMIHVSAPHFLWPFAVRYAAHQLNLWPRVSLPETSPTLRWTGEVGDASAFWVWGALSLVCDTTTSKLSPRTLRCAFLGFPTDAPPWQFYHPRSRRVFSSQDVTFDESGLAPSGVSQVDPPPLVEPLEISSDSSGPAEGGDPAADDTVATPRSHLLETPPGFPPRPSSPPLQPVAVDSGAAGGGDTGGEGSGGAETGGAETGGEGSRGAASGGADYGGAASPSGVGAVGAFTAGPGVGQQQPPSRLETPSPQQLREWVVRRGRSSAGAWSFTAPRVAGPRGAGGAGAGGAGGDGAAGVGCTGGAGGAGTADTGGVGAGGTRAGGTGGIGASGTRGARGATGAGSAGAGGTGGAGAAGPGGAHTKGAGDARASGAVGTGGAGGAGGTAGAGGTGAGGAGAAGAGGAGDAGAGGVGAADGADQAHPQLLPGSPLPAPAPHTEVTESLTERRKPETPASTPVRARCVARPRPPAVLGTHVMALRPFSVPQHVALPSPPASSLPNVPDPKSNLTYAASPIVTRLLATVITDPDFESTAAFALVTELIDFAARSRLDYVVSLVTESEPVCPPSFEGEIAFGSDVLEDTQFELEFLATASPRFASMPLCPEGDPDALDIPTLRSYAEATAGEYSSQWQIAMDAEMASWKSTDTCIDEVPPPGANIVDGMWIFKVKRPPGSSPVFKARYVARGFSQRQGVGYFQTFSPTPKMSTLWVLVHVAAQLDYELHSLDFSTAFLQGSLHEEIWLRCPPGFTWSFHAGTQWSLRRPVYGLRQAPREWHHTLRTTHAALGFAPSSADPSLFLRIDITVPPFYVLVYVNDFVFATTDTEALALVLQRFNFQYSSPQPTPLPTGYSLSAPPSNESVEPSGPYPELVGCLMYLMTCTRLDLAYPLSLLACSVAPAVRPRSTQELRWLTYLLTDLGERPRSPPVLYVDSKAMLALCQEQRLEHRTKHIALR
ncbi:unnamed protein product [Closterium sp. NIES-54]